MAKPHDAAAKELFDIDPVGCINRLKQFRRVATRYEKTARNFLGMVLFAAMTLWLQ